MAIVSFGEADVAFAAKYQRACQTGALVTHQACLGTKAAPCVRAGGKEAQNLLIG